MLRDYLHALCASFKRKSLINYGRNSFKQRFLNTLSIKLSFRDKQKREYSPEVSRYA